MGASVVPWTPGARYARPRISTNRVTRIRHFPSMGTYTIRTSQGIKTNPLVTNKNYRLPVKNWTYVQARGGAAQALVPSRSMAATYAGIGLAGAGIGYGLYKSSQRNQRRKKAMYNANPGMRKAMRQTNTSRRAVGVRPLTAKQMQQRRAAARAPRRRGRKR